MFQRNPKFENDNEMITHVQFAFNPLGISSISPPLEIFQQAPTVSL